MDSDHDDLWTRIFATNDCIDFLPLQLLSPASIAHLIKDWSKFIESIRTDHATDEECEWFVDEIAKLEEHLIKHHYNGDSNAAYDYIESISKS